MACKDTTKKENLKNNSKGIFQFTMIKPDRNEIILQVNEHNSD